MGGLLHQVAVVFAWPNGIVVGNLLAEVFIVSGAVFFRNRLGRAYAAWLHKHHTAHIARIADLAKDPTPDTGEGVKGRQN